MKSALKAMLPRPVVERLRRKPRMVWFGGLRRVRPINGSFGLHAGRPVDRYYIEEFLAGCAGDIRGRALEIGDDRYTREYGGDRVTQCDVLHVAAGSPNATIIADLAAAPHIPSETFDCIICAQTLMFVYDVQAAMRTLHRILKPGGTLLLTLAGISQICRWDMERWGDYWRFTTLSTRRLLEDVFNPTDIDVQSHGNVLTATAFLHGLTVEHLRPRELDHNDQDYQMVVTARAVKQARAS